MDPITGEIRIFAGNFIPVGWLLCDGSVLNTADYQPLFSLIGAMYGGNGTSTFALPDLRGRLAVGSGTGPALTPRQLGSSGGDEMVTITVANTPQHTHAIRVSKTTANNVANPSATTYLGSVVVPNNQGYAYLPSTISGLIAVKLDPSVITPFTGGGQPHQNVMPVITFSYIICANGLYPSPAN